ncbi:MAG: HEAT repeat domain-containing protein [Pseudomonadota bacterium]
MGSGGDIDAALALARTLAYSTAVLAAVLAGVTAVLRFRFMLATRAYNRLMQEWRPVIAAAMLGDFSEAGRIRLDRRNTLHFLLVCQHRHANIRGQAIENLNHLARLVGADAGARALLSSRNTRERLIAILTAGELRDELAFEGLSDLLADPNSLTSLASARALLQIDAERAARPVLAACRKRPDWPPLRVASLVKDAGATCMCEALVEALTDAEEDELPRLLTLLRAVECSDALGASMAALDKSDDLEVVTASLRAIADPRGLAIVRWYVSDERWQVRLQAIRALGRLGQERDVETLTSALTDRVWWVRHRAAEALSSLPFLSAEDLAGIQDACPDPYGRDALSQVRKLRALRALP